MLLILLFFVIIIGFLAMGLLIGFGKTILLFILFVLITVGIKYLFYKIMP